MASKRRLRCPACGSDQTLPFVYGYPGHELLERSRAGEVALGGCVETGDDPVRSCGSCGAGFWPSRRYRIDDGTSPIDWIDWASWFQVDQVTPSAEIRARSGASRIDGVEARLGRGRYARVEIHDGADLYVISEATRIRVPQSDRDRLAAVAYGAILGPGETRIDHMERHGFDMAVAPAASDDGWEIGFGAGRSDDPILYAMADWLATEGDLAPVIDALRVSGVAFAEVRRRQRPPAS